MLDHYAVVVSQMKNLQQCVFVDFEFSFITTFYNHSLAFQKKYHGILYQFFNNTQCFEEILN